MSAFVGLLNLDGRPCRDEIVGAMLERLRHRVDEAGWNARRVRSFGPVGLGSAPLGSTPQARFERESPDNAQARTQNGQTLCIAGHVRLDNREDLSRELALGATEAREWSDGRLVLEAYAKWSEETPRHLRGDFAFAIWDSARRRLFCARDRFGARPFYFAFRPGQLFACANEIKALWAVPGLAPRVNGVQAVAFLLARADDKERTFYEGVRRLPPASHLILDLDAPDNLRCSRYWVPDATRASNFKSDDETSEAVRETFFASVKERARAEGEFSLFLSGGLDSSSIASAAPRVAPQNKPVRALSMVFERFPECDEREWIDKNLAFSPGALEKLWIAGDDTSALHDIERILWHLDGPSVGPNIASTWTQYPPLQNAGSRVVLDGHGGDEVVFLGYGRVGELMRRGDYATAWRELRLLRSHDLLDASFGPLFWSALLRRARGTRGLGRLMALSTRRAGKSDGTHRNSAFQSDQDEMNAPIMRLLRPEARELIEPEPWVAPPHDLRQEHARTLDAGLQSAAMEVMDSMAGAHAVEVRCPFWEQNMVELCLSLPAEQKMRNGFNRFVMRRAMEGLLPPQVQWRTGKTNFSPQLIYGLRELERDKIERTLQRWQNAACAVEEFIEPQLLGELWASVQSETQSDSSSEAATKALALWRVLSLGLWLDGATRTSPTFQEEL
jgi:asparagine synthase (glutamine-hydrolysing)